MNDNQNQGNISQKDTSQENNTQENTTEADTFSSSSQGSAPAQNDADMTKKEKAVSAGVDALDIAGSALAKYYGGTAGLAVAKRLRNTKAGEWLTTKSSKIANRNLITRNILASNQKKIAKAKPIADSIIDNMGSKGSGDSNSLGQNIKEGAKKRFADGGSGSDSSAASTKVSTKVKLIVFFAIAIVFMSAIFFVVLITPLMNLGIIDIESISNGSVAYFGNGYTSVTNNTSFWWPVATSTSNIKHDHGTPASLDITSGFGDQESFRKSGHGGIDIGNAGNGPGVINVIASKSGVVTYPNDIYQTTYRDNGYYGNPDGGGYGNFIMIDHKDGTTTVYAHLAQDSIVVTAGQEVVQGQVIGKMGNSGSSTGTHLHFEVRVNGTKVFPLDYVDVNNQRPIQKSSNYVSGNSNKQSVCLSLKANKFSTNGAIALMTNIYKESSFNTSTLGDGGTSYGLCQWHNDRYTNLQNTFPDTYHTVEGQINFLMYELTNDHPSLYNDLLKGTLNAKELTYQFCKKFENPADTEKTCRARSEEAKNFTNYVTNNCQ